jgi:hypothetical protein
MLSEYRRSIIRVAFYTGRFEDRTTGVSLAIATNLTL